VVASPEERELRLRFVAMSDEIDDISYSLRSLFFFFVWKVRDGARWSVSFGLLAFGMWFVVR